MAGLTLLLVLAAATVLLAPLAERINLPYPVVMLIFGLALAFVPEMPAPTVNAELILPLVLPPLLFAAIALGAAVAPPDPVAATAVAHKLRLPRRLRTILEGEGLSNDATSLVLYEVAVAATMTGAFAPWHAGATLAAAVVIGVLVGLAIAVRPAGCSAGCPHIRPAAHSY